MTSELKKTGAFLLAAALTFAAAWFMTRPRTVTTEAFSEQGEPFFPTFSDPEKATALEVISVDSETASATPFKVTLDDKKGWVIPSHNDYPADAEDRLARTAAGVIDLKKDVVVSDSPVQHAELEVIDPLDLKSTELKGWGKRVTLRDKAGTVLADLIIGKAVPDRENQRYVRVPDQKRTYAVNLPEGFELSTRFSDWIETNLLQLDAFSLKGISINNYKVNPEEGTVTPVDMITLERKDSSTPWTMDQVPPGRLLDTGKVASLTSALADLKIVGVRPKPPGLTAELKAEDSSAANIQRSNVSRSSLASRGFYFSSDGRLLSNQGDISAATNEGVVYTLRFGEVTFATGEALTAGSEEEASKDAGDETKKAESDGSQGSAESRFLFVTAEFQPDLIPPPELPRADSELPDKAFQRTAEEIKRDLDEIKRKQDEYQKKLEDGKQKAKELTDRFAAWYYVVPGDDYRRIILDREALTRSELEPSTPPGGPAGNMPGFPGGFQP